MGIPIDFRDLHYAILKKDELGVIEYEDPKKIAGLISGKASPKSDSAILFADGGPYATATAFGGVDIELEVADLPLQVYAELLGKKVVKGQVVDNINDQSPYVAILYRLPKDNGKNRFYCYHKMKFELPDDEHKTAEDKPNFQTSKIKGKAVSRSDGNWRHRMDEDEVGYDAAVAASWFTKVPDPPAVTTTTTVTKS